MNNGKLEEEKMELSESDWIIIDEIMKECRECIIKPGVLREDTGRNKNGKAAHELVWTQSKYAWIATLASCAEIYGDPVTRKADNDVQALAQRLLGFAGARVCIPFYDMFPDYLLQSGRHVSTKGLRLKRGEPCSCHENIAKLWEKNLRTYKIMTGYAFLADRDGGMWVCHSWILHKDGYIIETTGRRNKYYGRIIDPVESPIFALNALGRLPCYWLKGKINLPVVARVPPTRDPVSTHAGADAECPVGGEYRFPPVAPTPAVSVEECEQQRKV